MIEVRAVDVRMTKLKMASGPSTFWDFGRVFSDVPFALITADVMSANGSSDSVTVKPVINVPGDYRDLARVMVMFNDEHIGFMNQLNGQLEIFNGNDDIEIIISCYIESGIQEMH